MPERRVVGVEHVELDPFGVRGSSTWTTTTAEAVTSVLAIPGATAGLGARIGAQVANGKRAARVASREW
jgi:hypothetical protein